MHILYNYCIINLINRYRGEDMFSKIYSFGVMGIDGYVVTVETHISGGLPGFEIVGLPDNAVKEAKERVRSAIKNNHISYPSSRITVNLAPSDVKKTGAIYDLPVLLGILSAKGDIDKINEKYAFAGQLSLDGTLRGVPGILPMAIKAKEEGFTHFFVPSDNANEAAVVEGLNVFGVDHISQLIGYFNGETVLKEHIYQPVEISEEFLDFADVKGQEEAKRALEIAAAGGHNVLMVGPPGSGKSMLAKRMPSILPPLTREEAIQTTKLYSISGLISKNGGLISKRPFRSPHHTVSAPALTGGGTSARPGEISLANNGVLFLDEFPQFHKDVLESLRAPLEDNVVTISRVSYTQTYPSNIMLVAAMNPCPCGYYGTENHTCTCSDTRRQRYMNRISGPMMDRIDLHVHLEDVSWEQLTEAEPGETSAEIRERVLAARKIQTERYAEYDFDTNSNIPSKYMGKFCQVTPKASQILKKVFDNMNLSARSYDKVLKVARTIADLEGEETINEMHILEAVQYRDMDREV